MQHDPTLWETVKKSLGAGFLRVGAGLVDAMQSLTSGMIVEDPSSPAGYTRTRSYEEALSDKNDPLTTASSYLHGTADRMSEEAQPHSGRKGFLDMLWDGEIGGFLQKGIATTGESLPMTLSAFNPYTMTLNAISMAGSNYRENTLANPDIPAWKRAAQAVGSAAIEQAVEKYSDPIFKYVGGGKILRGASKNASEKITNDITGKATETLAKRIYGRLKGIGKDALGEGAEEIIGNAGNDILGETLDIVDGNEDYGLRAQWKEMKKENPDADLTDFSKAKAKEYVESFIGGAMAGAYTSETAQLSTKALQYSFDKLGGGSVEENEEQSLNPLNVDVAQSYDEGYSEDETTGLQDTKNLYELRQNQMAAMFGVDAGQVDETIGDPVNFIGELQRLERNDEIQPVLDYINAKAKFDGMIQRVRDDIDGRIEQSNKMVNERTNHETGMIQGATLKVQDTDGNDRRAYILSGNLVMLPDGTGVDREKSGNSILILHEDTNEMEMVSPDAIFNIEQPVDPETEKQTAAEAIRQQYGQQEANRIDGVVPFYPGDTYTVTDESGQAAQIQVVPNKDGLVDNGDGTVNVSSDGGQTVVPMRKEDIQAMVDATNRAGVAQVEQQREAMRQPQVQEQPTYSLNDEVTLLDENGNEVRGSITADVNEDGQYEVSTENPINGRKVNLFTAEELNRLNASSAENSLQNGGISTENGGISTENDGISTENGNNGAENILQNGNIEPQNIPAPVETLQANGETLQADAGQMSALKRIPKDEKGQPIYEQADPDTAWDALLEQTNGDEVTAQEVANDMVADKEAALKKLEKQKPKSGTTPAEKIAARLEQKRIVEQAKADLNQWQKIAQTSQRRKQAALAEQSRKAEEAARLRREQEERERDEREEAERIRREALNGVPDFVDDTPQDARARGYRRVNGNKVDRQPAIPTRQGREVQVKFDDKNIPTGYVALIEASQLQPSHLNGLRNPLHFIDEAQPKERNDDASVMSARRIAANIRPEEITSSVTAYTGAPTVNTRGEVIQGNNRSAALREMWAGEPEQAAIYKQYLADHAADFGLAPEDVEAMQQPVLVNMLDVPDEDAITLGQFVASDTESGGTERIKPKNIVQKMGDDMRSFAGRLLASPDEEMTFSELVDRNGMDVLKWMQAKNYITPTQYRSAFDSKGNLTGEAKNDLKGIMYQSIFQNGNTHLEEMFGALPAKAQKAILATAYRDYDSPNTERLNTELQNSISAYYALSQMPDFANAKNYKEARLAVEAWKRQYALDDVTGESYLPSERYSNFALLLATMYKGQTQTFIQNTFNHIYDLVQGTQEATLFEEPDNTPRTLVEAINETLSGLSEELLLNGNFIYNGQRRNNVLAGSGTTGQPRGQGSPGSSQAGGRIEDGTETSNSNRRTEISGKQGQIEGRNDSQLERDSSPKQEEYTLSSKRSGNGEPFYQDADGNIDLVDIPQKVFDEIGYSKAPFRLTPSMILHVLNGHGKELGVSTVEETLHFVLDVMNHFDHVRLGYDGALIFSIENGRKRIGKRAVTILINSDNGKFYGLKTSGYETVNGLSKRPLLWERGAENVSSTTDAASASVSTGKSPLSGEQSGSASHQSKSLSLSNEVYSRHATTKQSAETVEVSQKAEQRGTQTSSRMSTSTSSQNKTVLQTAASKPHGDSIVSNGKDTEKSRISSGLGEKIAQAEAETNQNPTEAQKEAGNYKKGHVRIGQFDITVENPKGSVRRGTDASGKAWEQTMRNTYGYIRGTEGVDGDHIDVFLTNDIDGWNGRRVYIVDQYNEDGTFDEHKVMLGFNDEDDARNAYLSNYSEDWAKNRKIVMTSTNLEDFEKWIDSSHRKTKPFAEYKSVNVDATKAVSPADRIAEIDAQMADLKKQADEAHRHSDLFEEARLISESNELYAERRRLMQEMQSSQAEEESNEQPQEQQGQTDDRYTVEQRYHKKKDTYIYAVKFTEQMPREQFLLLKKRVKDFGGYYSSYGKGGFIFETEEAGRKFAEAVLDPSGEKLDDNKPLSLADIQQSSEPVVHQVDVEGLMQAINENGKAKLSDHFVMGRPGLTEKATNKQSDNTAHETNPKNSGQFGLVSDERMEELKKRLKQKILGQMNMGVDPEILAIGMELTAGYIDRGIKKFADYAKVMIDSLGDAIRPYLKSFYNGARDLPEVQEAGLADEMTPYDEVRTFDTANFDKPTVDAIETAHTVVQEQEVNKQAEEAKNILTTQRNEKERQKRSRNKKKSVSSQQTPDLFGNVNAEQNQEDDNYGLQRNDGAVRAEGLPTDRGDTEEPSGSMGETVGQESGRPDRSGEESGSGELRRSLQQSERLDGQLTPRNRNNNHVERGTDYAPTTPKARYDANVEAVRLAKELTDSGQQATDEQKAILRQFSGWGGLGTFFNNERTRNELVALLGDDGYQQAAMSINSAYYTPSDVIDAMWDIVKNLGFKGGNILEGSAGIGNILGLMPMDISDRSNIEAVEIDGVSGMILKLLYSDAKVDIQGFENTQVRNGSVDLAITNVPFVTGLHVHDTTGDRDLSRRFGNIHDFCIAKNVRKLRDGGIGVFISSSGTLDKSKALREWVVNEGNADFIGAFRLNNKTFGGTTATSDIIVVRKRINGNKSAGAIDLLDTESVRTVSVPINDNGREKIKSVVLQYNKYFVEHPENMGGEMALNYERGETFRPEGSGLFPTTGINQEERMQQWAETFKDKAVDVPQPQMEEPADTQTDTDGNEIKDGTIVVGEDGSINVMYLGRQEPLGVNDKKVKGHTKAECVEDYNRIKRALNAVLEYETTNEKDDGLKPLLKELNDAYDSFKDKYGNLNKNTAISFLRNDIDFPSIQALEKFSETNDKDGKRIVQTEKTSIFTERVVQKEVEPHPTSVLDAVKTSVFRSGRIDLDYISNALGRDVSDIEKEIIDKGLGFRDPATGNMEVSYEYLSGNVRQKLAIAEANNEDGRYDKNIKALRKVMPMDIPAHLIEFTFGSSWVNPKLFSDYVNEKTGVPVTLTKVGGQWNMDLPYYVATEKNKSEGVRSEKLNKIVLGTDLMNAAINNRTITVSTTQKTWDGKTETITDKEATQACAAKIEDIRNDFKDWARTKMQSNPEMAREIEQVYNERFNNFVPKTVTEEYMPDRFPGATTKINLYPHQKKAVIRATTEPLMLAHEVGTGKTFTLITTAMEMRRLGLARKPMIVVQNATVGQFIASAKELYPNAKVLTIADNERNEEGRKRFYAKIKYNDWDMIVVPQSVFERIPDSEERQMDFINDRIEEKEHVLEQIQEIDPKSMIARNAKRELDSLQTELAQVSDKKKQKDEKRAAKTRQNAAAKAQEQLDRATDDVENFDDMEIDAVLVDEAHEYKHLGFSTAMQRGVKGVDPSYSKKSAGVYLKTRAVMDRSGGKNVIFATGTPISNTAAEIWTFMRYLMPKHMMEEYGIYYFDDFVRNFGNLTQMLEFTTSGKFRENNRFAGYVNIPELIRIWSSVSDTVLTKETNLKDKLPETVDGGQKATDIYLPQSASLRSIMKAVRAELERFDNMSGKEKKENSAIPLVMYGIAKAAAIDPRLVMADEPVSKTNRAVEETLKSLEATKDYKGTVAIFCDTYQNNQTGFNIYEEIKRKLVERGVPETQIVIMRSGMSVNKKAEIFDKVNAGDVRVIMGSTFTLGTGVNIQERLNTLIHLDAPNRPMDYTQRNGRILRQGNLHKEWGIPVKILRFGVEDSLDITAYQRLKTKGAIADSVMEGKKFINNNQQDRTLEEQEDVFGDTVAQLSGSEYALLKNQAERDFRKYSNKKKQYETDQIYVHNAIPRYEGQIKASEETVKQQQKALSAVEKAFPDGTVQEITIGNSKLSGQKAIGDYIKDVVNKKQTETEDNVRKGAQGTKASSSFTIKAGPFTFTVNTEYSKDTEYQNGSLFPVVHRNMTYSCDELGLSNVPVQRASFKNAVDDIMNNVLSGNDMRERIETENNSIERNRSELEQLKSREGKPFENEKELEEARKKVEDYTEKMRKEMEAKEKKYAEMDAQTQSADLGSLSGAEEAEEEELQRSGDGALTDDELSLANDPVAKMTGRSTRTAAQRRAFAERERQRMTQRVQELAEKLHLDNVDIVTDASTLQGRRAKAKGFYSRSTGRITIVIPNHASVYDAEQTLLHEAVAHYGLRQLFGEHFDTFLKNVFQSADEDVRRHIVELAQKHGWDFHTATEEYLASLAESTNFDNMNASWWQKIKELFVRMLHKIGFEDFSGVTLSDNELRYILWRSYENLAEPGRYRSILGEAEDVAKQNELKVGNYAPAETATSNAAEASKNTDSGEDLFRDNEDDASAIYEKGVANTFWHRFSEGWYDYLRSVRVLQDALQKAMGRKLDDFENVLLNALHKTSVDKAQWDKLKKNYIDPLSKSLAKVVDGKKMFRDGKLTQDDVEIYLNCKHGLERNDKFAMRDAEQMRDERIKKADDELAKEEREAKSAMDRAIKRADQRLQDGEIDGVKHDQLINDAKKEYDKSIKKAEDAHEKAVKEAENSVSKDYQKNRERDYSGLTEIFDPEGEAGYTNAEQEDLAKQYVADMEQTVQQQELDELWDKIHKINAYSLKKSYESGLISKQTYESTKDMFDYYVPLRGFEKETANDVYDYITESDIPIEQVMKHAKGRTSRATNLIATMMNMAHSSIVSGNRNLVKQKLLNLALNADNDLLTIGNQWYEDDGMGGWIPVQEPPIRDGMTAKEAREVVEQFEENMKEREKNGEVRRMRKGVSLPIRIVGKRAENEHGVRVKRNGQEYVVWINGNPKAAQSINGILNPETERGWLLDHIHKLNRFVSKNVTSLRPNFLLSNLKRDILSSNMVGFVKYGLKYTRMFDKFVKDNLSIVDVKGAKAGKMRGIYALYHRYNNGTLDLNDKRDRYFKEFMENGGETGYSQMWSIDDYEKQIRRTLNKGMAKEKFRNGWQAVGDAVEFANRGIENVCRFAAYMASRESGMSVLQSIADAKEASVNFNRKGSGAMGNNAARAMFMFLNPAIQGFMQHNKLLMKYPKRMLAIDGGLIALGVIVGLVNSLIWGGGDDDDDKETENDYFNINPFVRRNNIVLRMGRHEYAKIDLPQELRPWYGLGEIAYAAMTGHMKHDNVGVELFSQLTQTIPLNPITGNALLSPDEPIGANVARNILGSMATGSITDAFVFDKDYAGNKITRANDYNKFDPEWKRAGRGTSSLMIGTTKMLNDLTGGNDYKKGWWDWNPSRWEHVATSMLGGRVEFFKQLWTTGQALVSGDEDERNNMRNYPFVSTSYINTDNNYNRNYRLNNEFDWYQHEFEQARHEYNGLKNDKKNVFEKAEEFDAFIQTPEYKIYRRFKKYDRRLKKQFEKLSDETDDDKRKKISDRITEIKKDAVEEMQSISK
jgi:N12 class adenine-specific DNA methylase